MKHSIVIFQSSIEEWRVVFWISFGIFVVTTVVYSIWASGEVQPWNFRKEIKSTEYGNVDYNAHAGNNRNQIIINGKIELVEQKK